MEGLLETARRRKERRGVTLFLNFEFWTQFFFPIFSDLVDAKLGTFRTLSFFYQLFNVNISLFSRQKEVVVCYRFKIKFFLLLDFNEFDSEEVKTPFSDIRKIQSRDLPPLSQVARAVPSRYDL